MSHFKFEPHADKFLGATAEDLGQEQIDEFKQRFDTYETEPIEGLELEKTEREIALIDFAERAVDKELEKLGRDSRLSVAKAKIHILEKGGVEKHTQGRLIGGAHSVYNSILTDRVDSDVQFAVVMFHELVHAKVFRTLRAIETEDGPVVDHARNGISVISTDGKKRSFGDIEEALTAYLERKFFKDYIEDNEEFSEQEKRRVEFGRSVELSELQELVEDIYDKNKDSFTSSGEVFELFLKTNASGRLLPLARLIEKTYGKGAFRYLGDFT